MLSLGKKLRKGSTLIPHPKQHDTRQVLPTYPQHLVLEQSFMCAIIAAASGKREVIVNSKGRERLREGESVVFVAKYE